MGTTFVHCVDVETLITNKEFWLLDDRASSLFLRCKLNKEPLEEVDYNFWKKFESREAVTDSANDTPRADHMDQCQHQYE